MIRLFLPVSLALALLWTAAITFVRAQPQAAPSDLSAFLLPPEGCPPPCWQGIRPGVTRADEAIAILSAHEWGGSVITDHYDPIRGRGLISWVLGDVGLEQIRRFRGVRLRLRQGVVQTITLPPGILLSEVWLAFGRPTTGETHVMRPMGFSAYRIEHYAYFGALSVYVRSRSDCPTSISQFWRGYTVIEIGEPHSNYVFKRIRLGQTDPDYRVYNFLRYQRVCRQ